MPSILRTVDDLVAEVRSQLDEESVDSVDTDEDILPALNRAQDYGFNILARHYEEPLLTTTTIQLTPGTQEYRIPEDCFEDRVERVEMDTGAGTYQEVVRISYRDISSYESAGRTAIPYYYCILGRRIRFVPAPDGIYSSRVWYLRTPERLVGVGGRIIGTDTGTGEIYLNSVSSSIGTGIEDLSGYVNVVDGQTGEVRGTLQLSGVDPDTGVLVVNGAATGSILGRQLTGDISTLDISEQDYICGVGGTCVPYFVQPLSNFMVQYAVAELTRKLGGDAGMEQSVLERFEKQVERTWVGRESTKRVRRRNGFWPRTTRRNWPTST